MKKILFTLLAAVSIILTACNEDPGVLEAGSPVCIAAQVAGTYEGTWTRTLVDSNNEPSQYPGTLTFTQAEAENKDGSVTLQDYIVNVEASCPDLSLSGTEVANISPSGVFFNVVKTATFGNEFSGKIKNDVATISFSLTIKEGRKQNIYNYTFSGDKK